MKKVNLILIQMLILWAWVISAQEIEYSSYESDIQLNECLRQSNYTSQEVLVCYDQAHNNWIQEMNKIYNKLLLAVNEDTKALLIDAQTEWMAYHKIEEKFFKQMYTDMKGSMYTIMAASRKLEIIRERAIELEHYYSDYTFDDKFAQGQAGAYIFNKSLSKYEVEEIVSQIRFFYNNCTQGLQDAIRVNEKGDVVPGAGNYNEYITFAYSPYENYKSASKITKSTTVAAHNDQTEWLFYRQGPDNEETCSCIEGEKNGHLIFYYHTDGISSIRMYFYLNQVIKVVIDTEAGGRKLHYPPFDNMDISLQKTIWPTFEKGKDVMDLMDFFSK